MNPPSPPPANNDNNSISHLAAKASLVAVLLGIGLMVTVGKTPIGDMAAGFLVLLGFVAAIVALAGIPAYGRRGILGLGLTGLVVNGLLIGIFAVNFATARRKAAEARAMWQNVKASSDDIRSDFKKSFDPETGITNVDFSKVSQLKDGLKNASQNLSGDDAIFARVMSGYLERMQGALTNYQNSVAQLRQAQVLTQFDPDDKGQFVERRKLVQQFLDANSNLKQVIIHSADGIRADLNKAQVSDSKIERFMAGYNSNAAPINLLTVQIRECDDRMGKSMLEALQTLETQWGRWKFDTATEKIQFNDPDTRESYNSSINAMKAAGEDQLKLQQQLVNRQQRRQP